MKGFILDSDTWIEYFRHRGGVDKHIAETPAYGLYARHVEGLHVNDVTFRYKRPDYRPAIVLDDVRDATLKDIDAPTEAGVEQVVRF